jgi:hypothetical protein
MGFIIFSLGQPEEDRRVGRQELTELSDELRGGPCGALLSLRNIWSALEQRGVWYRLKITYSCICAFVHTTRAIKITVNSRKKLFENAFR